MHDGREIRRTPTTGINPVVPAANITDMWGIAPIPEVGIIGISQKKRTMVRGEPRKPEVHVEGPADVVINNTGQGRINHTRVFRLERGDSVDIYSVQVVDGKGI